MPLSGMPHMDNGAAPELQSPGDAPEQARPSPASAAAELKIFTWNPMSVCPQDFFQNKLERIEEIVNMQDRLDDLIFLPEATLSNARKRGIRVKQLQRMQQDGYAFESSPSGFMAMYIKRDLLPVSRWEFPADEALDGHVGVVRSKDEHSWAVVGVYALNMHARPRVKAAGPAEREAFDLALFKLLEGLKEVRTVALVGDLNLVLFQSKEESGKGKHAVVRRRWERMLDELCFDRPIDRSDEVGKTVPTSRPYHRKGNDSRVDFCLCARRTCWRLLLTSSAMISSGKSCPGLPGRRRSFRIIRRCRCTCAWRWCAEAR
jgi:hypothetical protein